MRSFRRRATGASECPRFREAISARLDNEDLGMDAAVLDAHLARCGNCARFAAVAEAEHRRLRVRPAPSVPDLTAEILERLAGVRPSAVGGRWRDLAASGARRRGAALIGVAAAVTGAAIAAGVGLGSGAFGSGAFGSGASPRPVSARSPATARLAASYPGAIVSKTGVQKPAVWLTDTSGRPYDLARATAGKVTLVYFGYTHCPDVCPINMALAASALRDLPAAAQRRISVVFITTDPARDSPKVIRAWLDRFSPSFVGLTGSVAAIHTAERQAQVPLSYPAGKGQDYQVVHSGYTLLYATDGRANLAVDDTARPAEFATTLSHVLAYGFRNPS